MAGPLTDGATGTVAPASSRNSVELDTLLRDLAHETGSLMGLLLSHPVADIDTPTPAPGWTVRDQVRHLTFSDDAARLAITDRAGFEDLRNRALSDPVEFLERANLPGRAKTGAELFAEFLQARMRMASAIRSASPGARVPWFGPAMSMTSFVTARLMETWAHGQDIVDAFGERAVATHRLKHIADLGVRTLPNSFRAHRRPVPKTPVRVELAGPDAAVWKWGPPGGANRVTGSALDFCLAVTQRRHLTDTHLDIEGAVATEWMRIAQAFAGPPGPGRRAGQF